MSHVLHEGAKSSRIDVVFDVYKETSIKDAERVKRGADTGIQFKNIASGHKIQQWRKLLSSPSNKTSLTKFLGEDWKGPKQRQKLKDKVLYVPCEQFCFKITQEQWDEAKELESSQEEADTRLLLHALHAAESGKYKAIVITAEDTDVLILCLGVSNNIHCPMYQKCGPKNRLRFIDITKLRRLLGDRVSDALIGMLSFTGCDTVSSFAGRGKMTILKQMKSNETYQEAFSELGRSWEVSTDLFQQLKEITCHMYLPSTNTREVNQLRYQLFCARRGEWSLVSSPHVRTAFSCMSSLPTIRLPFGGNVCRVTPLFQTPRTMVGQQIQMASWSFSGCVAHLRQRQSYNCSPASVCVHANYHTALALAMA